MIKNTFSLEAEKKLTSIFSKIKNSSFSISNEGKQTLESKILTKTELVYIIPKKPLLKLGQILGTKKLLSEEEIYGQGTGFPIGINCKDAGSKQDNKCISLPHTQEILDFFSAGYKMNSIVTVCGERIVVIKESVYRDTVLENNKNMGVNTVFYFAHYIDIIDRANVRTIKTNMFSSNTSKSYNDGNDPAYQDYFCLKNLDMEVIEKKYSLTNVLDLIKPMEIIK